MGDQRMIVNAYPGTFSTANTHSAQLLASSFQAYINAGHKFWAFGKDVPYHRPPNAADWGLRHVHIISRGCFSQHEKAGTPLRKRTSDKHLVYAVHPFDANHYLLLAVINPDAHGIGRDEAVIRTFMDMCKEFWGF